jgi:UDP-N-acetylmuramoyl-L-alanyl-D-glutamate--2,6-diaminopimelate ligase
MEVSSHALAFGRTDAIEFEYGVFTNLTRDHLDFHGDMEEYFRQKSKLFGQSRRAVVNFDDEYGKRLCRTYRGSLRASRTVGDTVASEVECGALGCRYKLRYKDEEYEIKTGASGDFSVTNTQLAATVALDMGIEPCAVVRGLARFFGAAGRMERITGGNCPFGVFIDYAHTPDALECALKSVRSFRQGRGRVILLFGCGGDRDRGKRRQMASIASRLADFVIVTSDNPRSEEPQSIINDILKGIDKEKEYTVIVSRRRAIEYAIGIAAAGDIILLAGKGHEKYEIDATGKHDFDEISIVRAALNAKKHKNGI